MVTEVLEQAEEEDFGMSTLGQVGKDFIMLQAGTGPEICWNFGF